MNPVSWTAGGLAAAPRLALACLLLVALAGCGGTTNQPVKGTVRLGDAALTDGAVRFVPDREKGNQYAHEPASKIGPDGTYDLMAPDGPGAPPGWYRVVVVAAMPSKGKGTYSVPRSLVHRKFTSAQTTTLEVEVKPGAASGAYDLKVSR